MEMSGLMPKRAELFNVFSESRDKVGKKYVNILLPYKDAPYFKDAQLESIIF